MNLVRKLMAVSLFLTVCIFANAGIVEKMQEEKYKVAINPYSSIRYIGTLYVENDKLKITFDSDVGYYPTIMAYQMQTDEIKLIIKSRRLDIPINEYDKPDNRICGAMYWLVTLYLENDQIKYVCYWIEDPYIIIDDFTFNSGIVNERVVNVRAKPTTQSEKVCQVKENSVVKVTSIGKEWVKIARMMEFWLEIEIDCQKYWMYGYYIDFLKEMPLK